MTDELYNSNFFLHAVLDEYIGNEKGNNYRDVYNNFVEFLPEDYKNKFIDEAK